MKKISIARTALLNMLPQSNVLNLPKADLEGATFEVQDLITADKNSAEFGDDVQTNNRLRLKLASNKNNKPVVVNAAQLLRFEIAGQPEGAKVTLMDHLVEESSSNPAAPVDFPAKFTVSGVDNKKDDKGNVVYPSYMYQAMDEKINSMRATYRALIEAGKKPKDADGKAVSERDYVGQAYADYETISALPGGPLLARYANAEAVKTFKITIGS